MPRKGRFSVPLDCKLALGAAICDNMFFPIVCPGSPQTSILPMQKGNMNVYIYIYIYTHFQGFGHDPPLTQQAILYILFKNFMEFWYQCWAHQKFQFGIFDPRVHDFFVFFHDFLMSFHGLSTICPLDWSVAKKTLCFVFVPQTVHVSRQKKTKCRGRIIFQSLETTSGS